MQISHGSISSPANLPPVNLENKLALFMMSNKMPPNHLTKLWQAVVQPCSTNDGNVCFAFPLVSESERNADWSWFPFFTQEHPPCEL
jgi:hypothetical protein